MNHLEQLAKEYYEYLGYFVRTNVRFEKLKRGGYRGEADVLGFNPDSGELLHIECDISDAGDNDLMTKAERKFALKDDSYPTILKLKGIKIVRRILVKGYSNKNKQSILPAGIEHKNIRSFINEIYDAIPADFPHNAVPESFPLLRTLQFVKWTKKDSASTKGTGN